MNAVKNKLKKLTDKNVTVPEKAGGSTFSKVLDGEYLKVGVSVGVFNQTNTSAVNIKNNAKITAKNDVAVNSATEITRQNLTVDSEITNTKNSQNSASMIGLGVLVSNVNNNADIVVDGKLNAAEGSIKTVADGGMKYDQFNTLLEELKSPLENIKTEVEKLGTENKIDKDTKDKLNKKIDEYIKQIEETKGKKEKTETEKKDDAADETSGEKTEQNNESETSDGAIDFTDKISNLDKALAKITKDTQSDDFKKISEKIKDKQLKSNVDGIAKKLNKLNHPSNYANSYVNSAFHDSDDANTSDTSKLEAARSISVNTLVNNSRIILNKDADIKAEKSAVDINATAKGGVLAITGRGGESPNDNETAKVGAGISVMVGNFDNNALVAVGKSEINANDININSTDDSKHINLIHGNGKADSTKITGMVSYVSSPTNAIISIDDSAKLNAADKITLSAVGQDDIAGVIGVTSLGKGNGKSFGAAVNVISNDKNVAVNIGDNGYLNSKFADNISKFDEKIKTLEENIKTESAKENPDADKILSDKSELKILKINKNTQEILGEKYFSKLDESAVNADGLINAKTLTVTSSRFKRDLNLLRRL